MENTLVILSKEFINRIHVSLGEIQAKFAIPVINELQVWFDKAEKEPTKLLADVEAHLLPIKAKIEADAAKVKAWIEAEEAKVKGAEEADAAKAKAVVEAVETV
jgi:hypothetical protein